MELRIVSAIIDSIDSNSDIKEVKRFLVNALKSEPGKVLKTIINGIEVTAEKEEDSSWDPDFGRLDYIGVSISANGFTTEISKAEEIDFAISLLYNELRFKPSKEEESLIAEVQKVIGIDYIKIVTFDNNVYVISEFGERAGKDLLENLGLRLVEEEAMPKDGETAYTVFKFTRM